MKNILAVLMAMLVCAALAACNNGQDGGQAKIGVVDLNRLMRESAPGKAGLKFIEAQQTKLQRELDDIQAKLEKNPEDQAAMQELQKVYATSQQKMQAEGQNVVGSLYDAIQACLNNFRAQRGYALLIRAEALDSFDPSLDVTNDLLAEVDKLEIDFKPTTVPALEPEAAETAPAKPDKTQAADKIENAKEAAQAADKAASGAKPGGNDKK